MQRPCHSPENTRTATPQPQNGLCTVLSVVDGEGEAAMGAIYNKPPAKSAAARNDTIPLSTREGRKDIGLRHNVNVMTTQNTHKSVSNDDANLQHVFPPPRRSCIPCGQSAR